MAKQEDMQERQVPFGFLLYFGFSVICNRFLCNSCITWQINYLYNNNNNNIAFCPKQVGVG
jgi:hypothetical protein